MLNSSKVNQRILPRENELDAAFTSCPVCSSVARQNVFIIQKEPLIQAFTCKQCHVGYADRQPTEAFLKQYYSNYYQPIGRKTTIKKELLANHIIKHISKSPLATEYHMLDFGGGDGSVALLIANTLLKKNKVARVHIYVVDPHAGSLDNDNPSVTIHNFQSSKQIDSLPPMDLVLASAILEHIKDPGSVMRMLLDRLKTSGKFYARTPYIFPFIRLFKKTGISIDMQYPGHLFDMGNTFWDNVLPTLGYTEKYRLVRSQTSLVETSFRQHFIKAGIVHFIKLPSRIFRKTYGFVGGWEVIIERT